MPKSPPVLSISVEPTTEDALPNPVRLAHLFCCSSLASSSTSSGLSCGGEDGETAGEDRDVEEEVVCSDVGVATWLDI